MSNIVSEQTTSTVVSENTTAWLSTAASQIFFMQLGFLCYEAGFVKAIWTESIILKNIEDTFVGVLTFLCVGYTLSESPNTIFGIISVPEHPLLIGISTSIHDQILISAFFASTSATIISGAILERMKNKAYLLWCFLIVLINYSFVCHWVWNKHGWLSVLGFVDGAGGVVVHATGGMAALVAVWRLGPRNDQTQKASRPIINAIGAFFLWYGWFAFNVSSPIAYNKGMGDAIGTTALVTVISPICASCGAFILMYFKLISLSFEHLLSSLLAGLVAITGTCHTCNIWDAAIIGFLASIVYFVGTYIVHQKWHLDDPMQVISIHLFCGMFSCLAEGVVANNVYDTPGLIYGGYRHFGVQILGVTVICVFNFIVCLLLYDLVLLKLIFRHKDIKVSILDVYLGTQIFLQDCDACLEEVLKCNSNIGKRMLLQFHAYIRDRYASEQFDFLIVVQVLDNYLHSENKDKSAVKVGKYILQIIDTYIEEEGSKCVNISGTQRSIMLKIRDQILFELGETGTDTDTDTDNVQNKPKSQCQTPSDPNRSGSLLAYKVGHYKSGMDITKENVFVTCAKSVRQIIHPHFTHFLRNDFNREKKHSFAVKIPFALTEKWIIEWDTEISKAEDIVHLLGTIPQSGNDGKLLSKAKQRLSNSDPNNSIQIQLEQVIATNDKSANEIMVIFDDKATEGQENEAKTNVVSVVIE